MNKLKVVKDTDFGLFLDDTNGGEILLPNRYVPKQFAIGEELEVFVCYDSDDRLMATTETPLAQVGDIAHLEVVSLTPVGSFLNWGLAKDLFLPFAEQTRELKVGQKLIAAIYLDKSNRISASMRFERHLSKLPGNFQEGQKVDLFIVAVTDLGIKAIINGTHIGVLYENEVFQTLDYGQRLPGYIKKLREDGKIDLILQPLGNKGADDVGQKILDLLKKNNGFYQLTDKTSPEVIYDLFGVSKKKYKMALGGLYKKRLISIEDQGIRLT